LIDSEAPDRVSFLADTDFYIIKHQWVKDPHGCTEMRDAHNNG